MLVKYLGDSISINGITYTVGMWVKAVGSLYEGLEGYIKEIRAGEDAATASDVPDIHCFFEYPKSDLLRAKIEERFSTLYGTPKVLEELRLDEVVMAADMVYPVNAVNAYHITAVGNADPQVIQSILGRLGLSDIQVQQSMTLDAYLQTLTPNAVPGLADEVSNWIHYWGNGGGDYSTEEMIRSTCLQYGDSVSARELAQAVYDSIADYCKSPYEALTLLQEMFNEAIDDAQKKVCDARAVC